MASWYAGRGKPRGDIYIVKRNNIQSWINRTGCLSLPSSEVRQRIRKVHQQVMFFDMVSYTKFVTSADNFRKGVEEGGQVVVSIEKFDIIYKR